MLTYTQHHTDIYIYIASTPQACLTFDTDWAPDWAIRLCFEICQEHGVGATFFVTNPSPVLQEISADPKFELGIHPNLSPDTTQILPTVSPTIQKKIRTNEIMRFKAVIDYCLSIAPNAISIRTHGLWQSSRFHAFVEENTTINYNVSLFIPSLLASPFQVCYSEKTHRPLTHVPYHWEDDMACIAKKPWDSPLPDGICNFHPLHVALNTENLNRYRTIQKAYPYITEIPKSVLHTYSNTKTIGTASALHQYLKTKNQKNIKLTTIHEYCKNYR